MYLHNQRARIQRGHQSFSCKSGSCREAVGQSNVSKEASNPSQKTMRKELRRIWTAYAHGVLGCNNSFMSLHVWRVEIPAFLLKYIIANVRKVIQITSTLISPITRAEFNKF
ncbi:hypothetical protein L596_001997 [Steinernema carpocapsae]|uniref:Uncharacterized protein n=1 Tax=Steinernema carpocapsae TaxID=34508 RepID=A0A4U8UND4_STECR|nr:hypothetical protein L596_001997 [Steinernema carpocapsae]